MLSSNSSSSNLVTVSIISGEVCTFWTKKASPLSLLSAFSMSAPYAAIWGSDFDSWRFLYDEFLDSLCLKSTISTSIGASLLGLLVRGDRAPPFLCFLSIQPRPLYTSAITTPFGVKFKGVLHKASCSLWWPQRLFLL